MPVTVTKLEFQNCLARLGLAEREAAELLSVDPRTVRRWRKHPDEISGPARQALRAWLRLDAVGLAWRPDSEAIGESDTAKMASQIVAHRHNAIDLAALLKRVKERGGHSGLWKVDLARRRATLGAMEITFYALANGGFSPQSYTRRDVSVDAKRDWPSVEDGVAAVAEAVAKAGPHWSEQLPAPKRTKVPNRSNKSVR